MKLELTDKEITIMEWALIHWSINLENRMRTVPEKDVWDLYEEELNITEEIIKKIKNEETNQCTN